MKREYSTPSLTVHGNVEELTQATGQPVKQDTFTVGGQVINGTEDGSRDVNV